PDEVGRSGSRLSGDSYLRREVMLGQPDREQPTPKPADLLRHCAGTLLDLTGKRPGTGDLVSLRASQLGSGVELRVRGTGQRPDDRAEPVEFLDAAVRLGLLEALQRRLEPAGLFG